MPWSALLSGDPERLEIELRKLGIDVDVLVSDAHDVPELQAEGFEYLSPQAQRRRALEWFGDEGHPQPEDRRLLVDGILVWASPTATFVTTPDWGRLPPLHEDDPQAPSEPVTTPGAKSRWRPADLEAILVKQRSVPARKLAESDDLVEPIRHQRISELRKRPDIRVENGRVVLPRGTTRDGAGWITLPKLP